MYGHVWREVGVWGGRGSDQVSCVCVCMCIRTSPYTCIWVFIPFHTHALYSFYARNFLTFSLALLNHSYVYAPNPYTLINPSYMPSPYTHTPNTHDRNRGQVYVVCVTDTDNSWRAFQVWCMVCCLYRMYISISTSLICIFSTHV
ncbi:hypothetical protein EON63_15310 [archaeon]|nr:MAG: hypothetical protein EON63_15310 [archaeon]